MSAGSRRALLVAGAIAGGCHREAPVTVRVAAAISLREPLEALGRRYAQAHPGVTVRWVFGASGDLATQISRGAPVSLFASAAPEPLARLARDVPVEGLCDLATTELALVRGDDPALRDLTWENLATHPALHRLALGATPAVPAGVYAERALTALGVLSALGPKVVRGGHVRQVLDLVARGEADAGVVYATDLRGASGVVSCGAPPSRAAVTVRYPLALVPGAVHADAARAMGRWLCGDEAGAALRAYGFTVSR